MYNFKYYMFNRKHEKDSGMHTFCMLYSKYKKYSLEYSSSDKYQLTTIQNVIVDKYISGLSGSKRGVIMMYKILRNIIEPIPTISIYKLAQSNIAVVHLNDLHRLIKLDMEFPWEQFTNLLKF